MIDVKDRLPREGAEVECCVDYDLDDIFTAEFKVDTNGFKWFERNHRVVEVDFWREKQSDLIN